MNVLILYDLEGVIGVTDLNDIAQNSKLMETEVNIVVERVFLNPIVAIWNLH